MSKRIKQLAMAWLARISVSDRTFVGACLTQREQELFYGMGIPDQYHCRRVADDILRLSDERDGVDRLFLVRCALLHDVGRRRGDVSTADKVAAVLLHYFMPELAESWAREGRGSKLDNLRHALYVYYHHPERSVTLLRAIGAESELLGIVGKHHRPPADGDPAALRLLRQADDRN